MFSGGLKHYVVMKLLGRKKLLPEISVIIPVYNTEKYLSRCLDSVCHQTFLNIEIIVVNDGSTDKSLEIIQQYSFNDSRIRIISKKNGGLSSARNAGLEAAKGNFILHVDSDDWIELDMCEILYKNVLVCKSDISVCDVFFETNKGQQIRSEPYSLTESNYSFMEKYIFKSGLNSIWNKLIKRELYQDVRHYEDVSLGEDATALLRLLTKEMVVSYINKPLYHYNQISNGMSRGVKRQISQYYFGLEKVKKYYDEKSFNCEYFEFIRLKILYSELSRCSLKKALAENLNDYFFVAEKFEEDYCSIRYKKNYWHKLSFKYKLFVEFYHNYCKLFLSDLSGKLNAK